jgi:hypothetical protein
MGRDCKDDKIEKNDRKEDDDRKENDDGVSELAVEMPLSLRSFDTTKDAMVKHNTTKQCSVTAAAAIRIV